MGTRGLDDMEARAELANEIDLTEPHFDDEATILSARPVVPLDEVRSDRRHDRLRLAMIICAALLVGGFGATLIYRLAGNEQPQAMVDESIEAVKPVPLESGAAGIAASIPEPQPAKTEPQPAKTEPLEVSPRVIKPKTQQNSEKAQIARQDEWQREKELERAEKREARRQRRAERQARRREEGRPRRVGDTAIEQIFEGLRRP
jgi:hypothetical protein